MKIEITKFAQRHWFKDGSGTKLTDWPLDQFKDYINSIDPIVDSGGTKFRHVPYIKHHPEWSFCKYLMIPLNNINKKIRTGQVRNTLQIGPYIRTGYIRRIDSEAPYLSRWVELPHGHWSELAEWLVVVLYSKEQLDLESEKTGNGDTINADWGVVAIIGSVDGQIPPPQPSTILRNSMDPKYGGNGSEFNLQEYENSCQYWQEWIICK